MKRITVRHASKCRKCGGSVPAFSFAYWQSGYGVEHVSCHESAQASSTTPEPQPQPVESKPPRPISEPQVKVSDHREDFSRIPFVSLPYAEVRQGFLAMLDGKEPTVKRTMNKSTLANMARDFRNAQGLLGSPSFVGGTADEMRLWLQRGYKVSGLDGVKAFIPAAPRRKLRYQDEGDEMLIDLVLSGSDTPFVTREKMPAKPIIRIEASFTFRADVNATIIRDYGKWVAQMLKTFESANVITSVDFIQDVTADGARRRVGVKVKRETETANMTAWSAMFSPASYRMLGFYSRTVGSDKMGMDMPYGMGSSNPARDWDLTFDRKSATIRISSTTSRPFPEYEMTQKLLSVLAEVKHK